MSIASVRAFLSTNAPDIQLLRRDVSSATVVEAAFGLGVAPAQIAKPMALNLGGEIVLQVLGGTKRWLGLSAQPRGLVKWIVCR